ncbi:hypothetical protein GE061_006408 [Apolygus lucorum]|uniref:Uncharacterized protein n=1 Tax=Apolygus lucorum TaxID=248454 RepID=A0A8S9WTW0_APOLU|nr:hypothetical protein GE061_006408 [Apolygus lucorum]
MLERQLELLHDDLFWKRWTNHRWPGYHRPWAHGKYWKTYFLEKYLAECLAGQDPERCKVRDIRRLARRIRQWIYTLDIKQLSSPLWPAAVDVASSTDSEEDSDLDGILSDLTLSEYLNRDINFFPMPTSTTRLPMLPVFQLLINLTHLTFSFGYNNFYMHNELRFSKVTDEDAYNLGQALAACTNLYCFKLTRSKVTPKQLETIIFGLEELTFFREAEFSHMFLNNDHMVCVTGLLLLKNNLRILCLKNNDIGSDGFIRLLHVIILKDCKLRILDVSMNPIGDPGGVAIAALLAKKNRYFKRLFMSGTGLTYISGYNFGIVLYFNKCLEVLDLSVNQFSDFAAEALMKGLEHNYTLKRIDLRECGIPFTTLREMERICFKNAETERRQKYVYPTVHPIDFWSGFNELEAELPEEMKPEKSDMEMSIIEYNTTLELMQIFVWATAQMKPKNKFLLVRDIHALMKKTLFSTGFDAVVDNLILTKQKELIVRSRADAKREKEERGEGSAFMIDFSYQEFSRKTSEKLRLDFMELEALQVLKDVNRCGRIDELFKQVQSDRIDFILRRIGRHLDMDIEDLSEMGINLPFAKEWYKGFPDPEPATMEFEECAEEELRGEEEEGEEDEVEEERTKAGSMSSQSLVPPTKSRALSRYTIQANSNRKSILAAIGSSRSVQNRRKSDVGPMTGTKSSSVIGRSVSMALPVSEGRAPSNPFVNSQVVDFGRARDAALSQARLSIPNIFGLRKSRSRSKPFFTYRFDDPEVFETTRERLLGVRSKFRRWPKDGPPDFPKVIPYEIIKDCNDDLPETDSEHEEDFPYWLNQWFQKY